MTKSTNNYVDKQQMYEDLCEWKKRRDAAVAIGMPIPRITETIGDYIYKTAVHTASRPNFRRYTWKEEMIGDAIEDCLKAVHKFDPDRVGKHGTVNPFGFLSLVVWRAFVTRIKKEKKRAAAELEMMNDPRYEFFSQSDHNEVLIDKSQAGQFLYDSQV